MIDEAPVVERLARIETKLDVWYATHQDHESRIRRIERLLWLAVGGAGVGGGALSQWLGRVV